MNNGTTETEMTNTKFKKRKPHKNKKTVKKIILITLAVILTIILLVVGFFAYLYFFHEPDNGANSPPPFSTEGINDTQPSETVPVDKPVESGTVETTPPETLPEEPDSPSRSKQKIFNFLFVGQDRIALNTDVIMLISFNTTTNNVNVLQIPRDTYIEADNYYGKINGIFAHYYLNNGNNTTKALRLFANRLEQSLCIKIHNVGHINLDGVVAMVDAIGGVDVNVPAPVYYNDNLGNRQVIPAGKQHLNGYTAEKFIRHRATYLQADIGRIDAQKIFVSAFIQKLKSQFSLSTITTFVNIAFDYVTTDISLADSVFFAKQLLNVNMNNIKMMSMVGRGASVNGLSCWIMVRKNMREMIEQYFNIYDFEIIDTLFDRDKAFSSQYYPYINDIYNLQDVTANDPYNAEDINDGTINIPHV
ncbi:MAG: LytR family transcriptional regulator [Ruminococcaceae bacterium]|nr:LytR family transcriptional regulator [Oscillospiraceae bacterium]